MTVLEAEIANNTRQTQADSSPPSAFAWTISAGTLAYIVLITFALVLRLAELGTLPLSDAEAHEALSAYRVIEPRAVGEDLTARSPIMFTANAITMSVIGSGNTAARIATALVGVLLIASPLLLRRWIGSGNALIMAVLFTVSPVMLASSRMMHGMVWAAALAMAFVYAAGMFAETRRNSYALGAFAAFVLLVLMSDPGGTLMAICLGAGIFYAISRTEIDERDFVRETISAFPWTRAAIFGVIALIGVGTVFLLYPQGLSKTGGMVETVLRGIFERRGEYPGFAPLITSLLYEPVLWIFGAAGAYFILNGHEADPLRRFIGRVCIGWIGLAFVFALLYQGAESFHALLFTLPLAGLSVFAVERALSPIRDTFWDVPSWGRWLHATVVAAVLCISAVNLVLVGDPLLTTEPTLLPFAQMDAQQSVKMLMVGLSLMLVVITYFLAGSIWGSGVAWRGLGTGVLAFLCVWSIGAGWRSVIADDPRNLWQMPAPSLDLPLLDRTLTDLSLRATGTRREIPIVVQWSDHIRENGALAWLLHDFWNTTYVTQVTNTTNAEVVIAPKTSEDPQLGADYVGEELPVRSHWELNTVQAWHIIPYVYNRRTRIEPYAENLMVLWARADVYGVTNP
jgi:hypothetical protein